jgi:cytochrome c-type biogenesis protein
LGIMWKLVSLATADSVNPCTFYIFVTLMLALSLKSISQRSLVAIASAFILGVYVGYYLLGIGIAVVGSMVPRIILLTVAIAYGGIVIMNTVSEIIRGRPLTPKPGKLLSGRAVRAADAAAAAVLGLTLSFTLLPCSGGPLVAFIAAAVSSGLTVPKITALLLLYNAIFVAPLVAIAIAFTLTGKLIARRIPARLYALLELAAGALVIIVALLATA